MIKPFTQGQPNDCNSTVLFVSGLTWKKEHQLLLFDNNGSGIYHLQNRTNLPLPKNDM